MNSQSGLRCYPRRTFYLVSDHLSIKNDLITINEYIKYSLLDLSVLQSSELFCYCTLKLDNNQPELTYKPPLLFGRLPPQPNYQAYNVLFSKVFKNTNRNITS